MRLLFAAALGLAFAFVAPAQNITGSLVGTVTDSTGGVIAGARVSITASDLHTIIRTVTTDSNGEFVAAFLPVGVYTISVAHPGFQEAVRDGINLHVDEKLTIPVVLQVGEMAQKVTVTEEAAHVDLQSSSAANVVEGPEIRQLSINNR